MLQVLQPLAPELTWIISLGFIVAFLLAFSVGANDCSNSFGTSVGSRVLTVTQACILATFFEVAGATLLGYSVCDTFRRNMYDVDQYKNSYRELMLGALACLIGSAIWNTVATALKMPISGTHSIVGATIGFSIVLRGWGSIKWLKMLNIVISWFISPLLSGMISSLIYLLISKTIISKVEPLRYGLKALPLFYGATIFINVASVVIDGPQVLSLNELPWYAGLFISLVAVGGTICVVATVLVPRLRRQIIDELVNRKNSSDQKKSPKLKHKTTSFKTTTEKTGYDNVAFQAEGNKRELTLDPTKLSAKETSGDSPSAIKSQRRPPVAPKPAHLQLKRQQAQEQQLEEIDLGPAHDKAKDIESASGSPGMIRGERLEIFRLFSSLQILAACFASFAHGSNDISNAVAPLVPIWNIFSTGQEDVTTQTPVWILAFGGIGICTGLWAWGRAVMGTVGNELTQLTPSKGFAIELGAAVSVLCASKLGFPISTTHCKVGSVVIVGLVASKYCSQDNLLYLSEEEQEAEMKKQAVDWKLFGKIAITWIVTVPLAAVASAITMVILGWFAL